MTQDQRYHLHWHVRRADRFPARHPNWLMSALPLHSPCKIFRSIPNIGTIVDIVQIVELSINPNHIKSLKYFYTLFLPTNLLTKELL